MKTDIHDYPIIVRPLSQDEGTGYLAEVPDLPGCIADGETVDEAVHAIESAIISWIKTAKEFSDPIPKPRDVHEITFTTWRLHNIKLPLEKLCNSVSAPSHQILFSNSS